MKFSSTIRTGASAFCAVFLLAACTVNPKTAWNVSPAVAPVPPGAEVLSLKAPGLPQASSLRARYLDNYQEEEYVLYRGDQGAQAEIIAVEASRYGYGTQSGDQVVLDFLKITKDTVGMWNIAKSANLTFAESFPYENSLPFYLLPFQRGDTGQSCVGFHSEFNQDPRDPEGGNYDNQLFGYYCAPKGSKLSRQAMTEVVDQINISGVTTRGGPGYVKDEFQQLKNDPTLLAMVQNGSPKGQSGTPVFPLDIARLYDDNNAGGDSIP